MGGHARRETIVVLTGAGLSAESGISTFRDADGIWSKYDVKQVATPEAFQKNPELVHEFYNFRRRMLLDVHPNAAHMALARLEAEFDGDVWIVTQNVDPLHERAGSKNLIHMHGEAFRALCQHCGSSYPWQDNLFVSTACEACGKTGGMRPDVVWFGEVPYNMEEIVSLLTQAHLFVSIGTSGHVHPAAGFVKVAREAGCHTVELNLEPSEGHSQFADAIYGPATKVVPAFVERVLAEGLNGLRSHAAQS